MSTTVVTPVPTPRSANPSRTERAEHSDELVDELRSCTKARDKQIRDELVALTMPVAASIARRYRSRGVAPEDLRQVAYLALTKAVARYDANSGNPLLAFCVPTVRGEIRRYFRDQAWTIRPPRRIQELQQRVNRAESDLVTTLGRTPTEREIAEQVDEPVEEVREALARFGAFSPTSLDRPLDGAEDQTLGDVLGSDDDAQQAAEARVILAPVVRKLRERDRRILRLRFVEGLTQREIADDLGVTQMQVSRLLGRIFRDLRRAVGPLDPTEADGA